MLFFQNFLLVLRKEKLFDKKMDIEFVGFDSFSGFGEIKKEDENPTFKSQFFKFISKVSSLLYLFLFSVFIFEALSRTDVNYKFTIIYLFSICICSDIGGFIFGKIFKGKKLTKISPNKTISGSIGSFVLSLFIVPIFFFIL